MRGAKDPAEMFLATYHHRGKCLVCSIYIAALLDAYLKKSVGGASLRSFFLLYETVERNNCEGSQSKWPAGSSVWAMWRSTRSFVAAFPTRGNVQECSKSSLPDISREVHKVIPPQWPPEFTFALGTLLSHFNLCMPFSCFGTFCGFEVPGGQDWVCMFHPLLQRTCFGRKLKIL